MPQLRAALLFIGFLLITATCGVIQWILKRTGAPWRRTFPQVYYKLICRFLGIRVRVQGTMVRDRPVLIAANHTSYLDIVILGSVAPVSFIAKSEVAEWPLFGPLAKISGTVFVERDRRARTGQHRDMIQGRLRAGDTLVLFPEGTTSDGNGVLPFKSALMGAAQPSKDDLARGVAAAEVQPVAVAYTRLHGVPMGRQYRPFFAWYGDMELVPHLWEAFRLGPVDVDVHFYPPVEFSQFESRKDLTAACEAMVAAGVGHALSGRDGLAGPVYETKRARRARNGSHGFAGRGSLVCDPALTHTVGGS